MKKVVSNRKLLKGYKWSFVKPSVVAILLSVLLLFCIGTVCASSGGEGEHGAESKGWVATDTYRVMNFAVLMAGLFFILRKPLSQALDSRIKGIKNQLEDLEAKKQEAEKELASYNERLAQLDKEAEKIVQQYVEQGKQAKDKILKEAESAAEKLESQARKNIENEFEKAKNSLRAEILEKAIQKAEDLVKQKITIDDQERLVDEYLKKVVA